MSTVAQPKQRARAKMEEAVPLAQATQAAYAKLVEQFKRSMGLPTEAAIAMADKSVAAALERALNKPPQDITWVELHSLPAEAAVSRWEEILEAAREEQHSGHFVAQANGATTPWERAQFLAIREDLAQQWKPQGGVEWQLIDAMALAQAQFMSWVTALAMWASKGAESFGPKCTDESGRPTPRISEAEAIERAGAMAERFNKIFLRTLRALSDLRRHPLMVVVQNANQVNVGGQQVNVAQG
jgi:hypothetical protein